MTLRKWNNGPQGLMFIALFIRTCIKEKLKKDI